LNPKTQQVIQSIKKLGS